MKYRSTLRVVEAMPCFEPSGELCLWFGDAFIAWRMHGVEVRVQIGPEDAREPFDFFIPFRSYVMRDERGGFTFRHKDAFEREYAPLGDDEAIPVDPPPGWALALATLRTDITERMLEYMTQGMHPLSACILATDAAVTDAENALLEEATA